MKHKNRGFTLIELLVVISIVTLLSSIVLSNVVQARGLAIDVKNITNTQSIRLAIEGHYMETGRYPSGMFASIKFNTSTNTYTNEWSNNYIGTGSTLEDILGAELPGPDLPFNPSLGLNNPHIKYYSNPVDGNQSYALYLPLISDSNIEKYGDGSAFGVGNYVIGTMHQYCVNTYGLLAAGTVRHTGSKCQGGN